jgi:hypothetical protein
MGVTFPFASICILGPDALSRGAAASRFERGDA